jgi:hypothetical protein
VHVRGSEFESHVDGGENAMQSRQEAPFCPHCASRKPAWHWLFASQHPWQFVWQVDGVSQTRFAPCPSDVHTALPAHVAQATPATPQLTTSLPGSHTFPRQHPLQVGGPHGGGTDVPLAPLMVPEDPVVPVTPLVPVAPATPLAPEVPVTPETPVVPAVPVVPVIPLAPVEPATPVAPVDPVEPVAPVAPDVPLDPDEPLVPVPPDAPDPPRSSSSKADRPHANAEPAIARRRTPR